jgi:hypothetical protein
MTVSFQILYNSLFTNHAAFLRCASVIGLATNPEASTRYGLRCDSWNCEEKKLVGYSSVWGEGEALTFTFLVAPQVIGCLPVLIGNLEPPIKGPFIDSLFAS